MNKRVQCSVRFRAVGDVMVHQRQLDCALQPDGSYDFHLPFQQVKVLLGNADYTIANLETTCISPSAGFGRAAFRSRTCAPYPLTVGVVTTGSRHCARKSIWAKRRRKWTGTRGCV